MGTRRNTVTGVAKLAEALGLHKNTVSKYRSQGILQPAILSEYRRVVIFDLDKVYECLNHKPVSSGRPSMQRQQ